MAKRARRENDWPPPDELDRELISRLFNGIAPSQDWHPTRNIGQAMDLAKKVTLDRLFNFEVKWDREILKAWEARFMWNNWHEVHHVIMTGNYDRMSDPTVSEHYWAEASTPEMAICRAIINLLDKVDEREYRNEDEDS